MPYIKAEKREKFDDILSRLASEDLTAGEMNYFISAFIHNVLGRKVSYVHINAMIGVLECAKASLIETVLVPYEKTKMKENGNISGLDKDYYEKL